MKFKWVVPVALLPVLAALCVQPARAGGVVGTGTAKSCNELQLDAKLQFGGTVTFDCGPTPVVITVSETAISANTLIDGGGLVTLSGSNANRVLSVTFGVTLTLDNLRVANGASSDFLTGAAVSNAGTLILHHSQVVDSNCSSQCVAGGIVNGGVLQMFDSVVSGNQTQVGSGGIASITTGPTLIVNSTISNNRITNGIAVGGAGLIILRGTTVLLNSTVMSNTSATYGGGLFNTSQGTLILVNSTVSGNSANLDGGGIKNDGTASLYNATITNNQADADFDGNGTGGGVFNTNGATFEFRNTLLASNWETIHIQFGWVPHNGECTGTLLSWDYNMLENYNTTRCFFSGSTSNNLLTDPLLAPIADNGGPTWTHALPPNSPAINAGNPAGCVDQNSVNLATDQRGFPRLGRCDIGAYEVVSRLFLPLIKH